MSIKSNRRTQRRAQFSSSRYRNTRSSINPILNVKVTAFERFKKALEVIGILTGIFFVIIWFLEAEDRSLERQNLIEEFEQRDLERKASEFTREFQAWQILDSESAGGSGRESAITYLLSKNSEISGLDFSCRKTGGNIVRPPPSLVRGNISFELMCP